MPTATTFNSLQGDMQAYLERGTVSDTTVFNQLPRLINLAERNVARRFKIQGQLTPIATTLVAGTSAYVKPDRWRRTASMTYGVATVSDTQQNAHVPIYPRSYEYCRMYWPDPALTSPPKFYADWDYNHWLIVPTPDINYPWEQDLWLMPALLDSTNQSNWLTQFAPEVLLYRCLLEMEPFLKNDERLQIWRQMYEEAINNVNAEDLQKVADRSAVRKEA